MFNFPSSLVRAPNTRRERYRGRLSARRTWRTTWVVAVAVIGGLAAALFAKLCDGAMGLHTRLMAVSPWMLLLLPVGFPLLTWLTREFAPEAGSSGIPQVMAAAESRWTGRWGGQRVTLRTAAWKVLLTAGVLVCGGSTGREGPTVQVVAGIVRTLTRGLKGGPGRRAIIIAGGAAGVSAAFNTPIAGVVFAIEELANGFDKRTTTTVVLVVVAAGFASYAFQGDYAYFGQLQASTNAALGSAWFSAPIIGVVAGLLGGVFARILTALIGPGQGAAARWRRARPVLFAFLCGAVAAGVALASGGLTFGAGYEETKALITDHPKGGLVFAFWKAVASMAAASAGAPGGIFAPSLATGAGIGAAFVRLGLWVGARDAVVLGMSSYLTGVIQAPLTSAVILMEMTRDPGLVGPLLLASLLARWASGLIMPEPIYHVLAKDWRRAPPQARAADPLAAPSTPSL